MLTDNLIITAICCACVGALFAVFFAAQASEDAEPVGIWAAGGFIVGFMISGTIAFFGWVIYIGVHFLEKVW